MILSRVFLKVSILMLYVGVFGWRFGGGLVEVEVEDCGIFRIRRIRMLRLWRGQGIGGKIF